MKSNQGKGEVTYYVMITLILFTITLGTSKSQNCPDSITVTTRLFSSDSLADAEGDIIICTISGISSDQLEYYWWLIDDTNTPIYTYSEVYKIDEISINYKGNVISVDHPTPEQGQITSAMHLNFDKQHHIYRCEFVLKDYSICYSKFSIAERPEQFATHSNMISSTESYISTGNSLTSLSSSSIHANEKSTYLHTIDDSYAVFKAVAGTIFATSILLALVIILLALVVICRLVSREQVVGRSPVPI